MKKLLILTTEAAAEVLHDEHALNAPGTVKRNEQGQLIIPMWRGKVGKPEYAGECQLWRDVAESFTEHLMTWINAEAQIPEPGTPPVNTAKIARLEDELQRRRDHETYGKAQTAQQEREEELSAIIAKQTRRLHLNEEKLKSIALALAEVQ
jgi:hypothetical protein